MPSNGKKKRKIATEPEASMSTPDSGKVTFCVRMPIALHNKLVDMQAEHMKKTGAALSRNTLILKILNRHADSGRGIPT